MAVLGLHVFLQRGLNKLQREMCHKHVLKAAVIHYLKGSRNFKRKHLA